MTDTLLAVFDTETTGLGEDDEVVEVGYVLLLVSDRVARPAGQWHSLVRPGVPVKHDARANHHITDEELRSAPTLRELTDSGDLNPLLGDNLVVAHNMAFDERLMRQSGVEISPRRLCTWHLARHLLTEVGRYGNQHLRYYLEVEPAKVADGPSLPHRAMYDALTTAAVLEHMISAVGLEALVELQEKTVPPKLLVTCDIGKIGSKWRGRPWSEVDAGMLRWVLDRDFSDDVKFAARHWLERRG